MESAVSLETAIISQCGSETVFFLFIFPIFNTVLVICMGGGEKAAFLLFT